MKGGGWRDEDGGVKGGGWMKGGGWRDEGRRMEG